MSKTKIAITGTIGSGKTQTCDYLRKLGYDVFDCDKTNAMLLIEGNAGYIKVKEVFPECFEGNLLNKKKLADIVFNDTNKKKQLEDIMHPLILDELNKRDDEIVFAEVPLLFEANWDLYFDHKLLIVCDRDVALHRLKNRGIDENEAIRRINNQMPVEEKIKRADKIIYNNGSLNKLRKLIDEWLLEVL